MGKWIKKGICHKCSFHGEVYRYKISEGVSKLVCKKCIQKSIIRSVNRRNEDTEEGISVINTGTTQ